MGVFGRGLRPRPACRRVRFPTRIRSAGAGARLRTSRNGIVHVPLARGDLQSARAPDDRAGRPHGAFCGLRRAARARALPWARDQGRDPADFRYEDALASDREVRDRVEAETGRPLPDVARSRSSSPRTPRGASSTTAPDYLRLLHAWLRRDDLRDRAFSAPVAAGDGIGWGLGWGLDLSTEPPRFWHWGEGCRLPRLRPGRSRGRRGHRRPHERRRRSRDRPRGRRVRERRRNPRSISSSRGLFSLSRSAARTARS